MKYRVILNAEDGCYTLKDDFTSRSAAERYIFTNQDRYGEGQTLFVEPYSPSTYY
jgi:hypothetical protein